ncbi:hypothetical protein CIB95_12425 [Lottiidibacillus patelloidae]|uniref:RDD domain-containing protein n=1 Tax=Lottiidibacillus patelloidae TaxID=2670334 RepID=A0A263BRA8_9BACI|nr:RDD family protein [Lottiidibacillus patelloidae]OZM56224.1 hypothetical protein CIB95_12425 [Lottiidibacillus patelloidae]
MQNEYAGFWIRLIAYIIDSIIIYAIFIPIAFIVGLLVGLIGSLSGFNHHSIIQLSEFLGTLIGILGFVSYFTFLEKSKAQATFGKRLCSLQVTDITGNRLTTRTALFRTLGKYLSAFIFLIGFIMAAFTKKKQSLHDLIAKTYVIKKQKVN